MLRMSLTLRITTVSGQKRVKAKKTSTVGALKQQLARELGLPVLSSSTLTSKGRGGGGTGAAASPDEWKLEDRVDAVFKNGKQLRFTWVVAPADATARPVPGIAAAAAAVLPGVAFPPMPISSSSWPWAGPPRAIVVECGCPVHTPFGAGWLQEHRRAESRRSSSSGSSAVEAAIVRLPYAIAFLNTRCVSIIGPRPWEWGGSRPPFEAEPGCAVRTPYGLGELNAIRRRPLAFGAGVTAAEVQLPHGLAILQPSCVELLAPPPVALRAIAPDAGGWSTLAERDRALQARSAVSVVVRGLNFHLRKTKHGAEIHLAVELHETSTVAQLYATIARELQCPAHALRLHYSDWRLLGGGGTIPEDVLKIETKFGSLAAPFAAFSDRRSIVAESDGSRWFSRGSTVVVVDDTRPVSERVRTGSRTAFVSLRKTPLKERERRR